MSARAGRWDLLEEGSDPVPHDVHVIDRLADVYSQTGVAIRESAERLQRLAALDGWTGEAAEAFAEAAEDVHGDLADAERRYVDAGAALRAYVAPVQEARTDSWAALQDAEEADDERRRHAGPGLAGVAEPTPDQLDAEQRRADRLDAAEAALASARRRLETALGRLETASSRAARAIEDAAEHGKDGFWDNVRGGLRDFADAVHLKTIVTVVGWVALAVAAVALVVALVASAPFWLFAVAMGLGAVLLAGDLILWANGSGDAEWYNVALDVVGLVTLGFARPVTASANVAASGARGAAATSQAATAQADELARLAATPNGIRAANASGMAPGNNLRIWSDQVRAGHAAQAADRGQDAADAVQAGVAARPSPLQSLPYLDSDVAQTAAEVSRLRALGVQSPEVARLTALAQRDIARTTALQWPGLAGNIASAGDLIVGDPPPVTDGPPPSAVQWQLSDYEPPP